MKKILAIIPIGIALILILFIGIKQHPELNEHSVIIKHRPSLSFVFYSPIGNTDKTMAELSPKEKKEELLYREFIKRPTTQTVDNVALIFFQVAIYLLISSILSLLFFRRKYRPKLGRVITINGLGILLLLGMYQIFWTNDLALWLIISIQIVANLVLIFPLLRKNK